MTDEYTKPPLRSGEEADSASVAPQPSAEDRLRALGMLAGGVAHDFNNMLLGILANADLAADNLADRPDVLPYIEDIVTAGRRAAEMCQQLLAFSSQTPPDMRPIDPNRLVQELPSVLGSTLSKDVRVMFDLAPTVPAIRANATQLRQVFMNLLKNACQAIGEGPGTVSIRTQRVFLRAPRANALGEDLPKGCYVSIEVRDDGVGMKEEDAARIFTPFFTTKRSGKGLGLATALGIIRSHRGGLEVRSKLGEGTVFTVLLPSTEQTAVLTLPPTIVQTSAKPRGTILVVDDDPMVSRASARMLEASGFNAIEAVSAEDALEAFDGARSKVSAVLLDWTMEGMGGEGALFALRERSSDLPILVTSGFPEPEIMHCINDAGRATFLAKPFRRSDLIKAIQAVVPRP